MVAQLRVVAADAAPGPHLPAEHRRAALVQGELVLRSAGRPRQAVRQQHEQVAQRGDRRLGVLGHRPRAQGALRHGQRARRRHVDGRAAGCVRDPDRPG